MAGKVIYPEEELTTVVQLNWRSIKLQPIFMSIPRDNAIPSLKKRSFSLHWMVVSADSSLSKMFRISNGLVFIPLLLKLRKLCEREVKETLRSKKVRRGDAIYRLWHSHSKHDLTAGAVASIYLHKPKLIKSQSQMDWSSWGPDLPCWTFGNWMILGETLSLLSVVYQLVIPAASNS